MEKFLQINTLSLAIFGVGIFGIINYFITKITNLIEVENKEKELLHEATLAILHNKIYKQGMCYIERGWVSVGELNDIEKLFSPYECMGGNGTAKVIIENVRRLEIKQGDLAELIENNKEEENSAR